MPGQTTSSEPCDLSALYATCGFPADHCVALPDVKSTQTGESDDMETLKTHRFPVDVRWLDGKLTLASVPGKAPLPVATPPEFNGGIEGVWSPEDLFVGAVATCFTVTLVTAARRRHVPVRKLVVRSFGDVNRRPDGRYGFIAVDLVVELETDSGQEGEAEGAILDAEQSCLVAASLETPVRVHTQVSATAAAA
jgi:organic hydroperoxide reductase OsmC/OhrA